MKYVPSLEKSFRPMIVELRKFKENATVPFAICVERQNGYRYRYDMNVYPGDNENNYEMIERVIKSILWVVGGYKIYFIRGRFPTKRRSPMRIFAAGRRSYRIICYFCAV